MGVGEGMDNLEPFYPERMAQRVLGMGDVLTLYEKAASSMKQVCGWQGAAPIRNPLTHWVGVSSVLAALCQL